MDSLTVRASGVGVDAVMREHIRSRLQHKLGRQSQVELATVRTSSVRGPGGDVDIGCEIDVVRANAPGLLIYARGPTPRAAFDHAVATLERASASNGTTAGSNRRPKLSRMTSALEVSEGRPSRKSTRRSANHAKRDSNLRRRETRKISSPKARAQHDRAGES